MNESILILLKNKYSKLSEVEKKIADYIIAHTSEIPEMAIGVLAKKAGVASSGIIRFCKNMGLSGFSELKISLLKTIFTEEKYVVLPDTSSNDTVNQTFEKVFSSSICTLQDTLSMLDMKQIEHVVEALSNAHSIHFFGVGTSATIAQDAYYRFMRIGLPAYSEVDSHIMMIAAAQLQKGDVAIAVTHCGATIETVETLRTAKESGATTIAITSYRDCPICEYADYTIVVYSDEIRYSIEAVSARIAHIAVLDALCVELSILDQDRTSKRVKEMNKFFAEKRIN